MHCVFYPGNVGPDVFSWQYRLRIKTMRIWSLSCNTSDAGMERGCYRKINLLPSDSWTVLWNFIGKTCLWIYHLSLSPLNATTIYTANKWTLTARKIEYWMDCYCVLWPRCTFQTCYKSPVKAIVLKLRLRPVIHHWNFHGTVDKIYRFISCQYRRPRRTKTSEYCILRLLPLVSRERARNCLPGISFLEFELLL